MVDSSKLGIMLDLETLDLGPRSIITQVGIIAFPLDDPETEMRRISEYLPVQPQFELKRTVSFATILWWMEQEDAARKRLKESDGNDMEELLALVRSVHRKLGDLIRAVGETNVELWAKGPQFDVVNLETLFVDCGLQTPWRYDSVMDLRTLTRLAGIKTEMIGREGLVPHVAVEDAKFQIRHYVEAIKHLRSLS
jgi:hypothetical protein